MMCRLESLASFRNDCHHSKARLRRDTRCGPRRSASPQVSATRPNPGMGTVYGAACELASWSGKRGHGADPAETGTVFPSVDFVATFPLSSGGRRRRRRGGEMVTAGDLKSPGVQTPSGFESRPRYFTFPAIRPETAVQLPQHYIREISECLR